MFPYVSLVEAMIFVRSGFFQFGASELPLQLILQRQ